MWRATYITDVGKLYPFISLQASDFFLPAIFRENVIQGVGFCALPRNVRPREAILVDTEGREHRIEYPFQPGSPEWVEFWYEIKTNSLIINHRGIGEIIGVK